MPTSPISLIYCSRSPYKKEEWNAIKDVFELESPPGYKLGQLFDCLFLGSKPSSSDEERLEPFFSHRLTP